MKCLLPKFFPNMQTINQTKQTFKWDSCRRLWPLLWWDWPRSLSLGLRLEGSIYFPHTSLWLCCLNYLPFTLRSTVWSYLTYTLSRCIQNVSDLEMIEINSIIAPDKHLFQMKRAGIFSYSSMKTYVVVLIRSAQGRCFQWVPKHMFSQRNKKNNMWISLLITKTCLFKYIENFTTIKGNFSDKKFSYFSYSCSKHRLWVLFRASSVR